MWLVGYVGGMLTTEDPGKCTILKGNQAYLHGQETKISVLSRLTLYMYNFFAVSLYSQKPYKRFCFNYMSIIYTL